MIIEFTELELELIRKDKLGNDKPSYYDSTSDREITISDEFEAYLILQKAAQKQQILQRLRTNIKQTLDTADRDEILKEMAKNLEADNAKKLSELDEMTTGYAEFRQTVIDSDRRFDSLTELNRLLSIIKKPMEELTFQRDITFQDNNVVALINDSLTVGATDERTKRELDIWQKVISKYQGQL